MAKLTYYWNDEEHTINVTEGTRLFDVLQQEDLDMSFPCNGTKRCGKCRVHATGSLSEVGDIERRMLGTNAPADLRLACFSEILGDVSVVIPPKAEDDRISLRFSKIIQHLDPIYDGNYGFAVDIGTTTVVAYLFCKESLWALAYDGYMNEQQRYGADVLSRIDYANQNGVAPLREAIRGQLSKLFLELCEKANVSPNDLSVAVITGNTVMLHLLMGLEPRSLAMAPFNLMSYFGNYEDLEISGFEHMRVYLPRCISAYIGADITCSILAADLINLPDNTLLVDIGTNGEIVLKSDGRLICCSTAAGPAFEGAGISMGMSAKTGAISKVWAEDERLCYSTISGGQPVGICGSGLIDVIGAARELGIINEKGKIVSGDKAFEIGNSGVLITQDDIRELQMAKAAICAGIDTLMELRGIEAHMLTELILCGGFGSFLDPLSAATIGMIPWTLREKTRAIGNGAGAGASMILQHKESRSLANYLAKEAEVVELSFSKSFSKRYVKAMYFPEITEAD